MAAILKSEPDWSALPADTPPRMRGLLRRCLKKDRKERLRDIGDARVEIEEARIGAPRKRRAPRRRRARADRSAGERVAWIAVRSLCRRRRACSLRDFRPAAAEAPEIRADIVTPMTPILMSFAISPDGGGCVFAAAGDGQTRLWLRALDASTARPLAGTEGASIPFWSPDSRSIAFLCRRQAEAAGHRRRFAQALADAPLGQRRSVESAT